MNIAIVGATGNVGRKIIEVLEKKDLSVDNLYLVASSKSAGKKITFKSDEYKIHNLENFDFSKVRIAFCSRDRGRHNFRPLRDTSLFDFYPARQ